MIVYYVIFSGSLYWSIMSINIIKTQENGQYSLLLRSTLTNFTSLTFIIKSNFEYISLD